MILSRWLETVSEGIADWRESSIYQARRVMTTETRKNTRANNTPRLTLADNSPSIRSFPFSGFLSPSPPFPLDIFLFLFPPLPAKQIRKKRDVCQNMTAATAETRRNSEVAISIFHTISRHIDVIYGVSFVHATIVTIIRASLNMREFPCR